MAERSKRICVYDEAKLEQINKETMKLLNKYKIDMSLRELSEKSVYQYLSDIKQWLIYIYDNQGNQCITELDEDDIEEFLYWCKTQGNNSRRMKRRISSISAFYKFLRKKKFIKENPAEFISRPQKDVDVNVQTFLTKEQVELMKVKLKEHGDLQLETYALLSLSTMARVNAVAHLKWEQIDFDNRTCNDVLEKEGKIVTLFFSEEVKELLINLKEKREKEGMNDCGWVFTTSYSNEDKSPNNSTLNEWCKKIGQMIDVPTLHPHDFRHSGSQLLKLSGAPIELISELLNHSGLDVTKKHYLRADKNKMKQEKDRFGL